VNTTSSNDVSNGINTKTNGRGRVLLSMPQILPLVIDFGTRRDGRVRRTRGETSEFGRHVNGGPPNYGPKMLARIANTPAFNLTISK